MGKRPLRRGQPWWEMLLREVELFDFVIKLTTLSAMMSSPWSTDEKSVFETAFDSTTKPVPSRPSLAEGFKRMFRGPVSQRDDDDIDRKQLTNPEGEARPSCI